MNLMESIMEWRGNEIHEVCFLFLFFCGLWAGCPPMLRKREENEEKNKQMNGIEGRTTSEVK